MGRPRKVIAEAVAPAPASIVTPIINVVGEKHPLEQMEVDGEMPLLKSIGFARVSPRSRDFMSYVITSRGREIINIEVSEPNLKAIAIDDAKTSFVNHFINDDEFTG